jgi:hypothetical protein
MHDGSVIFGSTASLRPSGIGRYFGAVFLSVWLLGWAAGEVFAIGMLATIFSSLSGVLADRLPAGMIEFATSGAAGFVVLFLLVWLTLWTFGGIAAITHLLRSLAGEDSIALQGASLELVRRAGPFRRRLALERSAIRRIRLRPHDNALVADTEKGAEVLTQFGSIAQREAVADWLRRHLAVPETDPGAAAGAPPKTWEVTSTDGSARVRKVQPHARAIRSVIAWAVTGLVSFGWFASLGTDPPVGSPPALALTVLLSVGALLSTWGRREWIVRSGQLTFRRSFATWEDERTFKSARLAVAHHTDSDNDRHYKLVVTDSQGEKTIHSRMNDADEVTDLARWMASRTGFPLTLARPSDSLYSTRLRSPSAPAPASIGTRSARLSRPGPSGGGVVDFDRMRELGGLTIDSAFREHRQLLVRRFLLVQRLLQQIGRLGMPHLAGPGDQRPIRRHLVMFGTLAGRDETRVQRRVVEVFFHDGFAFLDDAGNAVTVLAPHFLVDARKHLIQALDLPACFLEMRFERRPQLRRACRLRHLGQRFRELLLGVIGVTEFVDECIV